MRDVKLAINPALPDAIHVTSRYAEVGYQPNTLRRVVLITGVPDDRSDREVIERYANTADLTYLHSGSGRCEFGFDEIGKGKIVR